MGVTAKVLNKDKEDLKRPIMSMTPDDLAKVEGYGRIVLTKEGKHGKAGDLIADLWTEQEVSSTLHKIESSGLNIIIPKKRLSMEDIKFLRSKKYDFVSHYE